MPEPVVIYGPAGAIPGQQDPAEGPSPAADKAESGETVIPPPRGLRIVRTILSFLGRVSWAVARAILHVIRRNPRHSLAAGASLLILGGIYYTQMRSGTARRDVTNAIPANQSPAESDSKGPDAAKPDPAVAAAPKSEASDLEKKATADTSTRPKPDEPATATAAADAASASKLPAPKPDTKHDSLAAAGSLAKADTPEKDADHPGAAPAPAPAEADHPVTPLPPPGGDLAKAPLLDAASTKAPTGPAPAPVSSLPKDEKNGIAETGPSSQTGTLAQAPPTGPQSSPPVAAKLGSEVPDDLLMSLGAPKDGNTESKPAQTVEPAPAQTVEPAPSLAVEPALPPAVEPAVAPAQSGSGPPPGEPKKTDGPGPKSTDPAPNAHADSITGLLPVPVPVPVAGAPAAAAPVVAAPVEQSPAEPKPVPAPEEKTAPLKSVTSSPASPPMALDGAIGEAPPAHPAPKTAESSHDTATSAPAPPVSASALGSEPAAGSGGENKLVSPAGEPTKPGSGEANATSRERRGEASFSRDVNEPGWISIPNSGMIPRDSTDDPAPGVSEADPAAGGVPAARAVDSRAHAARDVVFEPEPSQSLNREPNASDSTAGSRRAIAGSTTAPQPRAASHSERVEATDHVVERGENYWTISRQYYNSGRYHRALWKANESKYPDINVLHVGDIIVVPAPEDLDPDYILPARTRAPSGTRAASGDPAGSRGQGSPREDAADAAVSDSPSRSSGSLASGSVSLAARSGDAVSRRGGAADSDVDLPVSGGSVPRDRVAPSKGRSPAASSLFDGNADEPESRDSARPRSSSGDQPGRPVYRVRSYDTLRSIARDKLGDARRSDEILELNRGLIDNPAQLVVGQLLELPDDARTAVRRPASRR